MAQAPVFRTLGHKQLFCLYSTSVSSGLACKYYSWAEKAEKQGSNLKTLHQDNYYQSEQL
jgi:hypothetical protein